MASSAERSTPVNTPRPALGMVDFARYNLHLSLIVVESVCSRVRNGNDSATTVCVDSMAIMSLLFHYWPRNRDFSLLEVREKKIDIKGMVDGRW